MYFLVLRLYFLVMKNYFLPLILFCATLFAFEMVSADTISEERYKKVCRWGILNPPECKKKVIKTSSKKTKQIQKAQSRKGCIWGIFNPPKCRGKDKRYEDISVYEVKKTPTENKRDNGNGLTFYTGQFDITDERGDDETSLFGLEHKNTDLFRDTLLGRFTPISGGFFTGKGATYLYTGIEGQYHVGPLKILPSFAPGYYQKGDGKEMGDVLEFKSEVKFGIDLFENSNLGYSYSHISNNDWGSVNPGADSQSITFSKKF